MDIPNELTGLLGEPDRGGLASATDQIHVSGVQFDEEQNIERLQPDRLNAEEITSQHARLMTIHDGTPVSGATRTVGCRSNVRPGSLTCLIPRPAFYSQTVNGHEPNEHAACPFCLTSK